MKIRLLTSARRDLFDSFRFYEKQAKGIGRHFLDSMYSDIDILEAPGADQAGQIRVKVNGVDIFHSQTAPTAPKALPDGSSTPTTTKRVPSCATPTSLAPTPPTRR